MHTTETLTRDDFTVTIAGEPAELEDLLGDPDDRLGIVIDHDWGAAGASTAILGAVTAFYERLRAGGVPFFAYADHFAFHVGGDRGTLRKLDIHPAHKEVRVGRDREALLRAINDRGVTRLLVPDGVAAGDGAIADETLHSAARRIRSALAYAPGGRVREPDVAIAGSRRTEAYVTAMLAGAQPPARPDRHALRDGGGRPLETFRRLTLAQALDALG